LGDPWWRGQDFLVVGGGKKPFIPHMGLVLGKQGFIPVPFSSSERLLDPTRVFQPLFPPEFSPKTLYQKTPPWGFQSNGTTKPGVRPGKGSGSAFFFPRPQWVKRCPLKVGGAPILPFKPQHQWAVSGEAQKTQLPPPCYVFFP